MAIASLPLKPLDLAALIVLTLEATQPCYGSPWSSPTPLFGHSSSHRCPFQPDMHPSAPSYPFPASAPAVFAGASCRRPLFPGCEQVHPYLKLTSFVDPFWQFSVIFTRYRMFA